MYEVEVKVEAAHGPVRKRLADAGAESLGVVRQRDVYYDHPVRSFAESDEALRLRRETTVDDDGAGGAGETGRDGGQTVRDDGAAATATLTYKGPLVDDVSKTREEVETGVDDHDAADSILRAVGFEATAEVEKERERYAVAGYVVALDTVTGLGEFVEVEAHAEGVAESEGAREREDAEDGIGAVREGAFELCRRLGLDPDEATRSSYLALQLDAS